MMNTRIAIMLIFLVAILNRLPIHAQAEDTTVIDNLPTLSMHVATLSFVKNNEYFNPFVEGHTLAGYHIHPYFIYKSSFNVAAKFGFFIRRDWAATNFFSRLMPTFSVQYEKQAATFLIGSLYGGSLHRLIEPLYDVERTLLDRPETGLQLYYVHKRTFLDIWLHWLTLLDKPNNVPEELMAGLSAEQGIVDFYPVNIQIPLQMVLYHLGGQGISVKDYSLWMGALGGRITFQVSEDRFLKSICLDNYYVASYYLKKAPRPFKAGHGFFNQITFNTTWFTLQGSYWNAYGFSSENLGHPLYQSISILNRRVIYQKNNRQLALLHLAYQAHLTNELAFVLHIDPYYDINHHLFEHEAGLYVIYKPCFSLSTFEKLAPNS